MILRFSFFLAISVLFHLQGVSQGFLLIVPDSDCEVTIDGEIKEQISKNSPKKISLAEGEHFVQAKSNDGIEKNNIIEIENGKQKILKIEFEQENPIETEQEAPLASSSEDEPYILIADLNLTLSGGVNVLADEELSEYTSSSDLNYAFEKGDEVLIDGDIENKKGKFFIQLLKYPEGTPIYTKQKLEELKNHRITIREQSIYIIRIGTSAFFDKRIKLSIKRKPESEETREFNTTVEKKTRFNAEKILEPSYHFINSTSHETWKGGTNEIIIPITPPSDAIEWYYIVSASRNEEEIKSNLNNFSLLGDLGNALNGINPTTTAINIGLNFLTQPPGSNYCDVYLMDYNNLSLFKNDDNQFQYLLEGSRENVKSATVKVKCCTGIQHYLGIQNRSTYHGIHVGIEVVAVNKEEYLVRAE
ncbi:MAG: hypothetical protein P1U70_16005 [Saprospiraceae bacterium]|jgi:hypothetical protein|nr:hypothetical protein [Saprospiraceae bacterium]